MIARLGSLGGVVGVHRWGWMALWMATVLLCAAMLYLASGGIGTM
jgi:hypothetical protein